MRCVIQRVTEASVTVGGETVGKIGRGFMVLIGVSTEDMDKDYKDYLFHAKGAVKGIVLGLVVALLSGGLVAIFGLFV